MVAAAAAPKQLNVILGPTKVRELVDFYLSHADAPLYFDTETTGLNPRANRLVMAILKQGEQPAVKIDLRSRPQMVKLLAPLFTGSLLVIGHNLKFDLEFLLANGVKPDRGRYFDTMVADQLLLGGSDDEGEGVNLKATAARYGVRDVSKEERSWFIDLDQREDEWAAPFPDVQLAYADQDVDVLGPIYSAQTKRLKLMRLERAMQIEMDALPVIARMEHNGITVDLEGWRSFIAEKQTEARGFEDQALKVFGRAILDARIGRYDAELAAWRAAQDAEEREIERLREIHSHRDPIFDGTPQWGEYKKRGLELWREKHPMPAKPKLDVTPPNIGSTDQLIQAFTALGIEVPTRRNDKGERVPTTASAELEKLAKADPNVGLLLRFRKAQKFVDAFGEALLSQGEETGLEVEEGHHLLSIHADYQQIGAGTGRMSCRKPNFQQIPARGDGKKIRRLVRARPGHKLLTADFSNMEARILAAMLGEGKLYEALRDGIDLHAQTARLMFDLPEDQDPDKTYFRPGVSHRHVAKTINYLIFYGGSAFKLAQELQQPVAVAEELMGKYFAAYPELKSYQDGVASKVRRELESRTLSGRVRKYTSPGPEPTWDRKPQSYGRWKERHREWEKAWGAIERQAKNTPIQGSSADITKRALGLLGERLEADVERVVAVVHDEIVVETPVELADYTKQILAWAMEDAFKEYIPADLVPETEVAVADYWSKG